MSALPVVVADLTFTRINGGRAYGYWEDVGTPPVPDQRVIVTDSGSQQVEGVVEAIDADGTFVLRVPAYEYRVKRVPMVTVEVPPQARLDDRFYIREVQFAGDEQLAKGDSVEILDEGGQRLFALIDDITTDAYGPIYRVALPRGVDGPAGKRGSRE